MVAACAGAGVQLHTAFVSRFLPLVQKAQGSCRCGRARRPDRPGRRQPRPTAAAAGVPALDHRPELAGGGALIDHSVHVTDAMRHISGLEVEPGLGGGGRAALGLRRRRRRAAVVGLRGRRRRQRRPELVGARGQPVGLRLLPAPGRHRRRPSTSTDLAESVQLVSPKWGGGLRLAGFADDADLAMIEALRRARCRGGRGAGSPCAPATDGLQGTRDRARRLYAVGGLEASAVARLPRKPEGGVPGSHAALRVALRESVLALLTGLPDGLRLGARQLVGSRGTPACACMFRLKASGRRVCAVLARVVLLQPGVAVGEAEGDDRLDRRLLQGHVEVAAVDVGDLLVALARVLRQAVVEDVHLGDQDLQAAVGDLAAGSAGSPRR